ncbi:amidase [Ancylomarina euxinus]|uniref:Amidase n=1 Tax=Ancylomarina euxinus TaxID=2283627 RepID=A0A425XYX5_9BACT|nr:amidase [Ancylomarina euxinus]MCZ4695543.1 amidase [Ancylomarina euxinus]MUP15924.1 amidase [Ancylomarina euxinus]RRG20365.1 amidase [Ancylomarina euxinus]
MKRRHFLSLTALGTSLISSFGLLACQVKPSEEKDQIQVNFNEFPFNEFPFNESGINELQEMMQTGKLSAEELVKAYLNRINQIDKKGPAINAVIEINTEALALARELDLERKVGKSRGPLHGIPIMLKDNIDTGDKMMTSAGSLALEGNFAEEDAFVVKQLRNAGAIILGKTNLSEWANFRSTRSSSGWSGRGGQTHNPYVLDRSPCGSSSGSAVAVAANLCVAALGTETDGSVVCPSGVNGVVGIKPSLGLVSRTGIIPIAHSQDTAGPMAKTVKDAAILLTVMLGQDENDSITMNPNNRSINYAEGLHIDALKGAKVGVVREFFGFHSEVDKVMEKALDDLKSAGAELIDIQLENINQYGDDEYEVLLYEFKDGLNKYLSKCKGLKVTSLEDIIQFNEKHKELEMPWFDQEIMHLAQQKGDLNDKAYLSALKKCKDLAGKKGIDATLKKHKLDVLVAPTNGPAWNIDLVNGDHFGGGSSAPAAVSGYPNVTVPAGYVHALPIGLSFFAESFSEQKIIRYAYAYEQATKHRKAPEFYTSPGL